MLERLHNLQQISKRRFEASSVKASKLQHSSPPTQHLQVHSCRKHSKSHPTSRLFFQTIKKKKQNAKKLLHIHNLGIKAVAAVQNLKRTHTCSLPARSQVNSRRNVEHYKAQLASFMVLRGKKKKKSRIANKETSTEIQVSILLIRLLRWCITDSKACRLQLSGTVHPRHEKWLSWKSLAVGERWSPT